MLNKTEGNKQLASLQIDLLPYKQDPDSRNDFWKEMQCAESGKIVGKLHLAITCVGWRVGWSVGWRVGWSVRGGLHHRGLECGGKGFALTTTSTHEARRHHQYHRRRQFRHSHSPRVPSRPNPPPFTRPSHRPPPPPTHPPTQTSPPQLTPPQVQNVRGGRGGAIRDVCVGVLSEKRGEGGAMHGQLNGSTGEKRTWWMPDCTAGLATAGLARGTKFI